MRIARILYPVTVLGPGKRIAIWVAGCKKRCKGCANQELWQRDNYPEMSLQALKEAIDMIYEKAKGEVDGITISGGEPFEQAQELLQFIQYMKKKTSDILIFTGMKREEWMKDSICSGILNEIAVLIDGEYIEEENHGEVLRGSTNQNIRILNHDFEVLYEEYQRENEGKHLVENFRVSDGVVAVGIHKKDFRKELDEVLKTKDIYVKNGGVR